MSASYRRGSQLIRQQIEDDGKATKGMRGEITALQNQLDLLQTRFDKQQLRINTLERQNSRLKLVVKGRHKQIRKLKHDLHYAFVQIRTWAQKFIQKDRAHQKLSVIVRVALKPTEYQDAHECAAGMYPRLFNDGN